MHSKLIKNVEKFIALDKFDVEHLKTIFRQKFFRKNKDLITCGILATKAYFINSGYLRHYKYIDGNEVTIHLLSPGDFATCTVSFYKEIKSLETLHTVTDCELLEIKKSDLDLLYEMDPKWQEFGRKLMQQLMVDKEERIIEHSYYTAEDKYLSLLKKNPQLLNNVPIQYIASYIGIQPESLSRIRKKLIS